MSDNINDALVPGARVRVISLEDEHTSLGIEIGDEGEITENYTSYSSFKTDKGFVGTFWNRNLELIEKEKANPVEEEFLEDQSEPLFDVGDHVRIIDKVPSKDMWAPEMDKFICEKGVIENRMRAPEMQYSVNCDGTPWWYREDSLVLAGADPEDAPQEVEEIFEPDEEEVESTPERLFLGEELETLFTTAKKINDSTFPVRVSLDILFR